MNCENIIILFNTMIKNGILNWKPLFDKPSIFFNFIKSGININEKDNNNKTILELTITLKFNESQKIKYIKQLIHMNVEITSNALDLAVEYNNFKLVKLLLKQHINIDIINTSSIIKLLIAIKNDDTNIDCLLSSDYYINIAIIYSIYYKSIDIIKYLINNNILLAGNLNTEHIELAIKYDRYEIIKLLLNECTNKQTFVQLINGDYNGKTILLCAIKYNHNTKNLKIINYLLEMNAIITIELLEHMISKNYIPYVKLAFSKNIDVKLINSSDIVKMVHAIINVDYDNIKQFIDNNMGNNSLIYSIYYGNLDIIKYHIDMGIKLTEKILNKAIEFDDTTIIMYFIKIIMDTVNIKLGNYIGNGRYGYVYNTFDPSGNNIVIKILLDIDYFNDENNILKLLSVTNHKGFVKYISGGCIGDFNMGYILFENAGETLETILEKNILSDIEKNNIAISLVKSIDILHSSDIIHNDIKLDNITFSNNTTKIIDFGLATIKKNNDITHLVANEYYDAKMDQINNGEWEWRINSEKKVMGMILYRIYGGSAILFDKLTNIETYNLGLEYYTKAKNLINL